MAEVGALKAVLTLDKAAFSSGLSSAKGELSSFGAHSDGVFSKMGSALGSAFKVGAAAAVASIATVTAALTLGTKSFAEYETAMAEVARVSGGSAKEMTDFSQAIRQMAMDTGSSVTELTALSSNLSSAGVDMGDLVDATGMANKMMISYNTEASKTSGFVGTLMKTYKMGLPEVEKFGSALNVIEAASKASPTYLMDYMGAMSELNSMYDIDTNKAMAFAGVFADADIQASEAATSLSSAISYALQGPDQEVDTNAITELAKRYEAAGMKASDAKKRAREETIAGMDEGNARMTQWAQLLGTNYEGLVNMLNTDFMGTMQKSAAAIGKIEDKTKRLTVTNEIWGRYGTKTIAAVSGQIQNYGTYIDKINEDIKTGSQSMTREYNVNLTTLNNMFDRAKQTVNDFGISIGKVTSGPLKEFLQWFIGSGPVISAALNQALGGDIFGAFRTIQPVVQEAMNGVVAAISSAGTSIQTVLSQINFTDLISRMYDALGNVGSQLVNGIGSSLSAIGALPWESYFQAAHEGAVSAFAKIGDAIINQPWASWAGRAVQVLAAGFRTAVATAVDIGEWIMAAINSVGSGGFQSAGADFAGWLLGGLGTIKDELAANWVDWIVGAVKFTGTIGSAVIDFAAGMVSAIGAEVKKRASEVWSNLTYWTSALGTAYTNLGKTIIDYVGQGIASGVNAALKPVEDGLNALITKFNEIFKTDISKFSLNVGTGNTQGTDANVGAAAAEAKNVSAEAMRAAWEAVNGNGRTSEDLKRASARAALSELGLANFSGDPLGFMKAAGQKGLSYQESYKLMGEANVGQGKTMAGSAYQVAWNEGKYIGMGGINETETGLRQGTLDPAMLLALGLSGARNTFSYPSGSGAGAGANPWQAPGEVAMENFGQQWGGGVVPVFVTNWGGGGGGIGGAGGASGGGILPDYVAKKAAEAAATYAEKSGTLDALPNMKDFNNMLVKATAEGSDFCNAMSEFGYIQEQVGGIFRESYIGPTSGWFGAPTTSGITTGSTGGSTSVQAFTAPLEASAQTIANKQLSTQKQVATKQLGAVTQQSSIAAQRGEAINDYMDSTWMDCMNAQENATEKFVFDMKGAATGGAKLIGTGATQSLYTIDKLTGKISVSWANVTDRNTAATIASIDAKTIADKTAAIRSQANQAYIDEMWAKTNGGACAAWDEKAARWRTMTTEEIAQATQNRVANQDSAQNVRTTWETGSTAVKNDLTTGGNTIKTAINTLDMSFGPTGNFMKAVGAMEQAIGVMTASGGPWTLGGSGDYWAGLAGQNGGGAWVGQGIGATTLNTSSPYYASWGGAQASYNARGGTGSSSVSFVGGVARIGKYAEGGMVTKPQIALLGESGREAVLPNKLVEQIMTGGVGGSGMMAHVSVVVDGKKIADAVGPAIIKRVQQAAGLKVR